jgi:cell division protein FtsB
MSEPRGNGPISIGQIFSAAAVAFAIFIFVVQAQRLTTNIVLWRQLQETQAEIDAGRAESDRLQQRKLYVQTNEYIESVARHDMKMGRPGEISVVAVTASPAAQATVIATPGY